jgi:hypothetical protein
VARRPTAEPGKTTRRLSGDFTPFAAWRHIEEFVESGGGRQNKPRRKGFKVKYAGGGYRVGAPS